MKVFIRAIVCLVGVISLAACDSDRIITAEQLPASAKTFIQKSYPGVSVAFAKQDKDLFRTKYDVCLDNGMEIEFDGNGFPRDIDMDLD